MKFVERPLPSNDEAERCILGGILLDQSLISQAAELLQPEDFYSPLHRKVYAAMLELFASAKKIDPILIGEELKKEGDIASIGGITTITNLTWGLPHFSNVEEYIELVRKKKAMRDLVRACSSITSEALAEETDADIVIDRAEQTIFNLSNRPDASKPTPITVLTHESITKVGEIMKTGVTITGVKSGLADLDRITGGWKRGDLIIVAARPSMGKTALALQCAANGTSNSTVSLYFSLEMTKEELAARFICSEARINLFDYRNGRLMQKHYEDAVRAYNQTSNRNLLIDDSPAITPMQVFAKSRRVFAQNKRLDLIVVDYIQLMNSSKRTENRVQEVSQISRELKAIAKELTVPVIALSQLSRAPEARNPPRPLLSDLRESGSIEQDADVVVFIYREEYYKKTDENAGLAELIVAKQRNGPTDSVRVLFLKSYTKFEDFYEERRY